LLMVVSMVRLLAGPYVADAARLHASLPDLAV